MWMKTELSKCPTAAQLGSLLLWRARFSCLLSARENTIPQWHRPDPEKGSSGNPSPSKDRAEPLSPLPESYPQSQGNSRTRMNAGLMGTASRKERVCAHSHALPFCLPGGSPKLILLGF